MGEDGKEGGKVRGGWEGRERKREGGKKGKGRKGGEGEKKEEMAYILIGNMSSLPQLLVCMGLRPTIGNRKPVLALYEFDRNWNLSQRQIHSIPGLNYAHDFLLLPDYYVVHMTPFATADWWTIAKVVMGWSSLGHSMRYYQHLPSRFVVVPRHTGAKHQRILQLDTDAFHVSQSGSGGGWGLQLPH